MCHYSRLTTISYDTATRAEQNPADPPMRLAVAESVHLKDAGGHSECHRRALTSAKCVSVNNVGARSHYSQRTTRSRGEWEV